jgi:hypothetical protein
MKKYAREKYYEKDSEDIYIIEFEGDTIEKNKIPSQTLAKVKCEIYSNIKKHNTKFRLPILLRGLG